MNVNRNSKYAINIPVIASLPYRKHRFKWYGNDSDPSGISGGENSLLLPRLQHIEKMRAR